MMSSTFQNSLKEWDVSHRLSSADNPHFNYRAKLVLKVGKKLLRDNTGGSLDRFMRASMQFRNNRYKTAGGPRHQWC